MTIRNAFVRGGDWKTLETFWNVTTTAFFAAPAGAKIKVKYGGGWFAVDRQTQTLDGHTVKKLSISGWSAFTARIQILTANDATVVYDVEPGDVAVMPPETHF